jgi:transaldolase
MNRLADLTSVGTSIWVDAYMTAGELDALVRDKHVTGLTSNPTILERSLATTEHDEDYEGFVVARMRELADVLRPVYDATGGRDGYVSVEVDPELANDTDGTVAAARELWTRLGRPNAMIKIPATRAGVDALRQVVADGINVNATLLFTLEMYEAVARAYIDGLADRRDAGLPVSGIASVASFFVSRVDSALDPVLRERGRDELAGRVAVANARAAYAVATELFAGPRFQRLAAAGAQPQRLLWASTGTKDGRYSDVKYVEELAGPGVVNTMPLETLHAFEEHGVAADQLTGQALDALLVLADTYRSGIDIDAVGDGLLEDGISRFQASMDDLLNSFSETTRELERTAS